MLCFGSSFLTQVYRRFQKVGIWPATYYGLEDRNIPTFCPPQSIYRDVKTDMGTHTNITDIDMDMV